MMGPKKVLLVVPRSPYNTDLFLQQPICFLYTAAILKQHSYDVSILDLRIIGSESIEGHLTRVGIPDVAIVTTSTYDLTQCYAWNLDTARQAVEELRRYCPKVFVVGAHGTLNAKMTLDEVKADGVLTGEVELVIPQFLDDLCTNSSNVPLFEAQGILNVADLPVPDFSIVPLSDYTSYIPKNTRTLRRLPSTLLFANRGCPYTCSYCYTGFFGGTKLRLRPAELVIQEMRNVVQSGVEHIFFLDYTFTAHKKWLDKFLTALSDSGLKVRWGCQTRAHLVDETILSRMAQTGCQYIWYGIESPDISSLNQSKLISKETMENAIQWTCQAGIVPMAFLLVGLPGEDVKSMADWVSSQPIIFSVEHVLPRYGTDLFKRTNISIESLEGWQDLQLAAKALQPDQERVDQAYEVMTRLPNYFANIIATHAT